MGRKFVKILGIKVDSTSCDQVLDLVRRKLKAKDKFYIVTPNPEIVLRSLEDSVLQKALNAADISLPDGIGLFYASLFLWGKKLNVLKGREVIVEILSVLNNREGLVKAKIYLLGSSRRVNAHLLKNFSIKYKNLKFEGSPGPKLNNKAQPATLRDNRIEKDIIIQINNFNPDMLFIAFGCPKQEKWLSKNWDKLNVKGAMVVGGAFDYLSGKAVMPPEWLSRVGFEWLWRLVTRPERFKRIFNAVIKFPLRVVLYKFSFRK